MPAKIGELLVKDGIISRKQLEDALKCQVIFGGRLGTNLIEMGMIEEQRLVEYLSKQLEVPYATPEQLMNIPQDVINLVSRDMVEEYKIVPLSLEKKRLTVAIWDPSDLSAIDAISFITGYIIRPLVCSELRLLMAMEQYYGIKRQVRYIQMQGGTGLRTRDEGVSAPKAPGAPQAEPSPFESLSGEMIGGLAPGAEQSTWGELIDLEPMETVPVPPEAAPPEPRKPLLPPREPDLAAPAPQPEVKAVPPLMPKVEPSPAPVPAAARAVTVESILATLAEARDRDNIADALVGYLGEQHERVALFMIKGRIAVGWRGASRRKEIAGFDKFQVPLDDPSLLKVVTDTRNFYLGPILDQPGNAKIIAGLGGGQPHSALLIPLMMMERVVTVLYLDGDKALLGKKLFDLQKLAGKAALAFEILILKNKILMA